MAKKNTAPFLSEQAPVGEHIGIISISKGSSIRRGRTQLRKHRRNKISWYFFATPHWKKKHVPKSNWIMSPNCLTGKNQQTLWNHHLFTTKKHSYIGKVKKKTPFEVSPPRSSCRHDQSGAPKNTGEQSYLGWLTKGFDTNLLIQTSCYAWSFRAVGGVVETPLNGNLISVANL